MLIGNYSDGYDYLTCLQLHDRESIRLEDADQPQEGTKAKEVDGTAAGRVSTSQEGHAARRGNLDQNQGQCIHMSVKCC